jgi:threonine aldolase
MDGARLANAVTYLGTSFLEMTTNRGIDVLSLGGTKNGFLFGEAVVFLNPELASHFKFIRKQSAQLPSKTRFLAASFERYLSDNLWRQISERECSLAEKLHQEIKNMNCLEITQPRQSNAVFVKIPPPVFKQLRQAGFFFYVWDEKTYECRLMTSWDTTISDINEFCQKLRSLL